MEANSSIKSVVLAVSQYCSNATENTLSKLLRHIEVLHATLHPSDADEFFIEGNELGCNFVLSISRLIENERLDDHLVTKVFLLLHVIAKNNLSCNFLSNSNLLSSLYGYGIRQSFIGYSTSLEQCLQLIELLTYDRNNSEFTQPLDKFLSWVFETINQSATNFSSVCLGILSNLVNKNILIQAKVKVLIGTTEMKNLMKFLKGDNMCDKICTLTILANCCWEGNLARKLFSKNVRPTLKLLFSCLPNSADKMTQYRAADLCEELMKHDEIASDFIIYETEQNITTRLLNQLGANNMDTSKMILEVLLAFSHIPTVRHMMCSKVLQSDSSLNLLLNTASLPISKINSDPSNLAMDFIFELCEEAVEETLNSEGIWILPVVETIIQQLTPAMEDEKPHLSDFLLNSATLKILKALKILTCLCIDNLQNEEMKTVVAQKLNCLSISNVIEHQLTHNLTGLSQSSQPQWSTTGVEVVLSALDLCLKLKHFVPDLEKLLQDSLQDTRIVPFLSSAITGFERSKVQIALRLHQEALPLPDFPSILLSETIAKINKKNITKLHPAGFETTKSLHSSFGQFTTSKLFDADQIKMEIATSSTSKPLDENKENIQDLIAKIQTKDTEGSSEYSSGGKTSQIMEIYEQKLSSLVTKENQIQDLLEAKTLALSQADRLISQYRSQRARSEEDTRRMAELLKNSEMRCEGLMDKVRAAECDRSSKDRELDMVVQENRNLQNIADQYDQLQTKYHDRAHKNDVLERNLKTSRQEYDTLKELHDMIQKHNEKLKQQNTQASSRLEDLEENRFKLLKRVEELERSVSDLTQLVEEQDKSFHKLMREKGEADLSIKTLKLNVAKRDEDVKELKIKVSSQEHSKQQIEHQVKERNSEIKKLNSKMDAYQKQMEQLRVEKKELETEMNEKQQSIENLKQKLDKQAQTLLMITELSNNIRGSQS